MPSVQDEKRKIRQTQKRVYLDFSTDLRKEKSILIVSHLIFFLKQHFGKQLCSEEFIIGIFSPLTDEPDIFADPSFTQQFKNALAFPNLTDNTDEETMHFYHSRIEVLENKEVFGRKMLLPKDTAKLVFPNVICVPGVAFTTSGVRLGRGKGYYDRFLENFSGPKLGITFREGILKEIPFLRHDQSMDFLISDENLIKCGV